MELFRADLHIHSRFSRATSKKLTLRLLAAWAQAKGLDVIATGDFTHPEWMAEIEEYLEPDGSGLYVLKDQNGLGEQLPFLDGAPLAGNTRFMLCTEISSIYKKAGKVRKNHNLVFMPSIEMAKNFSARLAQVGNLESDGRPILGLDAKNLLEMVLETGPNAFLVPAHIWTPWFSLFGSKSGFDSMEECFGDLSSEIFALETGLSSDPDMNWLWSALDRYTLISNSDAHSGEKLGRESNLFQGEKSYDGIYHALRGEALGHRFLGTVEFFPEEGKYHLDGHRKCGIVMDPAETRAHGGMCPVCGKPLTVGVLNRVQELADRELPEQPAGHPGFQSLFPLPELVSEVLGVGPTSKKVKAFHGRLLARLGSEMDILQHVPFEDIAKISRPLAEGVRRMRQGHVLRQSGFDGQYGVISAFSPLEREEMQRGASLIAMPSKKAPLVHPVPQSEPAAPAPAEAEAKPAAGQPEKEKIPCAAAQPKTQEAPRSRYNVAQQSAIDAGPEPVLVIAGPGTGKTHTLMGRLNRLLSDGVKPRQILTLTFTRRAADELQQRLVEMRGENEVLPRADTLHAIAFECWEELNGEAPVILSEENALRVFAEANPDFSGRELRSLWQRLGLARERMELGPELLDASQNYSRVKDSWNLVDYTDLLEFWLQQMESGSWANPYLHVLVDEVQDLSALQLRLVTALAKQEGEGFFAIGDPDQSIYSFRGAQGRVRSQLKELWPSLRVITLEDNYRSAQSILNLAHPALPGSPALHARVPKDGEVRLFSAPTAGREAQWIGERVRELVGSTSHTISDAGEGACMSPGDIAILVRFKALIEPLRRLLDRFGLPCAVPEAEAFWTEPRVDVILATAGRSLGINPAMPGEEREFIDVPDKVLMDGPVALEAYLQDTPPFDRLFWESSAFRKLKKAYDEQGGWLGLVNWVNMQTELDLVRSRAQKIQIMTLHAAKGLEFEAVFMPALEQGILPFAGVGTLTGNANSREMPTDEDEERRLFYVGLTRAKSRLYLSHSASRMVYGHELRLKPTAFLKPLPEHLLKRSHVVSKTVRQTKQLNLLG